MTDFKGFGEPPATAEPTFIYMNNTSELEMDRALKCYLKQGVSKQRALNLVATGVLFRTAEDEGMIRGKDFHWTADRGIYLSEQMTQFVKQTVPEQAWDHMKMEGYISETSEEEPERATLSCRDTAKLLLLTAQNPTETNDGGEAARRNCITMMVHSGLPQSDAEDKLRRFLAGDESLLEGMLDLMAAALTEMARKSQGNSH